MSGTLRLCCPEWWDARNHCHAWGPTTDGHGCRKEPGHDGAHVCPCGARRRQRKEQS